MEIGKNIAAIYELSLIRKAAYLARKKIITLVDEPDIRTAFYGITDLTNYEDRDWDTFKRSALFGDSGFVLALLDRHSDIEKIDYDAFYEELGAMEEAKVNDFLRLSHVDEQALIKTKLGFVCLRVKHSNTSIDVLVRRLMKYVTKVDFIVIVDSEGGCMLRPVSERAMEAKTIYAVTIRQFASERYRDHFKNMKGAMGHVDQLMMNKRSLEEHKFKHNTDRARLTDG